MAQPSPQLFVGRPNIGDRTRFLERVGDILDRRWLSNGGKYCQEFEERLRDFLQVKHAVAVCNATVGLEIATRAAGFSGEVIVPSFTFVATAHCLQWQGVQPVFADIDPATHNLDPARIEDLITPRTTGILAVHCWGRPAPIRDLEEIARRHSLQLMFDASHAFGCTSEGKMIGGFGVAEVFSFHATKFINSFEGGVITTNDDTLAERIQLMRNFGFTGYDQVDYVGTNGKMSEVSAAMGLTNLESLEEFVAVNRRNHFAYRDALSDLPGVRLLGFDERERSNYQYVVLEIDPEHCPVSRDRLLQSLHDEGVIARRYFHPGCHRMEPYRSLYPQSHLWLAQTEAVARRVLILPTGTAMDAAAIDRVTSIIRTTVGRASSAA
jgi:dTDP-4-amino-4,6-dideoxygalactose transaminase